MATDTPPRAVDEPIDGHAEEIHGTEAHDPPPPPPPPPAMALEHVQRPEGSTQLIVADTAADRVQQATEIATALDQVIRAQGMRTKVGSQKKIDPETGDALQENGRDVWVPRWHVNVEGWQTLATLLGLAVVPTPPRPVIDPETGKPERVSFDVKERTYHPKSKGGGLKAERTYTVEGYSWQCRVEVFKDGVLIGAGESVCSRTEQRWKDADDYAVMGMAQTRATSRAIGAAARWIVTLAGYSATPAEEIPTKDGEGPPAAAEPREQIPQWALAASEALQGRAKPALGQLVGNATGALEVWQQIIDSPSTADPGDEGTIGYMPAIVAQAILRTQVAQGKYADTDQPHGAEPVDEPPAGTGAPPVSDIPPAGSIDPEDGEEAARAACTCPAGFDRIKAGEVATDDLQAIDDSCPVKGHGIPF